MGTKPETERRYRSWPESLKREIVAASLEPGASVAVVARRYAVNANQVFSWRQRFRAEGAVSPGLVPVMVTASRPAEEPDARIEIELPAGYRVRVGDGAGETALRLVLDVLERR